MNTLFFGLGIITAVIIGFLIVVTVVIVGLRKKVSAIGRDIEDIYHRIDDAIRDCIEADKNNMELAKSYIDSRIDKAISK